MADGKWKRGLLAGVAGLACVGLMVTAAGSLNTTSPATGENLYSYIAENEVGSNRYAHPTPVTPVENTLTTDGFEKILASDRLEVYYRNENCSFRFRDLETGYIWGSLISDKPNNMNSSWSSFANGIVAIEYYDKTGGSTKRIGAGHADSQWSTTVSGDTVKIAITFTKLGISLEATLALNGDEVTVSVDDSTIQETDEKNQYTIGSLYLMPFLGTANGNPAAALDPEELPEDTGDADGTDGTEATDPEGTDAEGAGDGDEQPDAGDPDGGDSAEAAAAAQGAQGADDTATEPTDAQAPDPEGTDGSDAGTTDPSDPTDPSDTDSDAAAAGVIDGYMFIPDGSGAIIRFSTPQTYREGFEKRVYGMDYGIDDLFEVNDLQANRPNDFATPEQNIYVPLFGIVHGVNQNAFYGAINTGAEYASIVATPSGVSTDYSWTTAKFVYRQIYLQPTSKSGAGVRVVQKTRNTVNPSITYRFLTGDKANYAGMAVDYRETLLEKELLSPLQNTAAGDIPVRLDMILSDIEQGFLWDSAKEITTTEQVEELSRYLYDNGLHNLQVTLLGYQKGGLNGYSKFHAKLKNASGLQKLGESLGALGIQLFAEQNTFTGTEKQFDINTEVGITLSQDIMEWASDNPDKWLDDVYYGAFQQALQSIDHQQQLLSDIGIHNMSFPELGSLLYGNYLRGEEFTRTDAVNAVIQKCEQLASELQNFSIGASNQYTWKYLEQMTNLPMTNSQYLYESDSVPFMQILLSGTVELFAPHANVSFYTTYDVLKHIEYGTYPSFLLTGTENYDLSNTPSGVYNSTYIPDWQDRILEIYGTINDVLQHVRGQSITGHTALQNGVMRVEYASGSIYVNYLTAAYEADGVQVPAQSAIYVEGR